MWVIHKCYTPSCCELGMWRHQQKEVQQGKKQIGQTFRQVLNKPSQISQIDVEEKLSIERFQNAITNEWVNFYKPYNNSTV